MNTLTELVQNALERKVAIGHFNISNIEGFWAVVNAAKELNVPVIIGVSEGERDFIGVKEVAVLVKNYREYTGQPVFLNADHTYSFERVKEVVDAGYDSVIFDGTELSFEKNVEETKKCREYMNSKNPNMLLEAELGFIGKSSKILEGIPEGVKISEEFLTKPEDAVKFLELTGVNMLAPAVGNIHGMLKGGSDPALSISTVKAISEATKVPLVLHGASGNSKEDIQAAIDAGVAIVHVNTELRVAYKEGLKKALAEMPNEVSPYKYLKPALQEMQRVAKEKLIIFNKM